MTDADTTCAARPLAWTIVLVLLVAIRLPSLVEPAGADQSLYAYVGQRIDAGGVPYLDAWDQKPPAIHFIYAALWRAWPHESAVAAADLAAAALTAWLLVLLGRRTFGATAGYAAAALFLLLGNPGIQRLGGVRVRAQCETFIALAVTAALAIAAARETRPARLMLAGAFLGLAFWLKYNAGIYFLPALALAASSARPHASILKPFGWLAVGFSLVAVVFLSYFGMHGALTDLYLATVSYNIQYSRETYTGIRGVLGYLVFPVQRAQLELLWYLGGLGAAALLVTGGRRAPALVAVGWVAAACVSIAVNGARDLPQYFVQAHPALALAAAAGLLPLLRRPTPAVLRAGVVALIAAGVWKVGDEPARIRLGGLAEAARNAAFDLEYSRGRIDRTAYLQRFQLAADTKYVPLSAAQLTETVRATTRPTDRILVFGLAASVYVDAPRESASRFFWSRPVVVEFGQGRPGYGAEGLLQDLRRSAPAIVALQKHWDAPSPIDFFMADPPLRRWLEASYTLEDDSAEFAVWRRRS